MGAAALRGPILTLQTDPRLVILQMSVSPASLARLYEEDFKQDMAALKVGGW